MGRQDTRSDGGAETPFGPQLPGELLDAAAAVIQEHGFAGLTLERLARAAGSSRMTLHRRGVAVPEVVAGLSVRAAAELQVVLFPLLASTAPARERLEAALAALFHVADRHLPLLAGLFDGDDGVFHAAADDTGALPTAAVFVAPFVKLLADGAADGTLAVQDDLVEAATVLFNAAGWGYVQLRHSQRWPPERARDGVMALVVGGLLPR